jgi:tetratricopeptide (TPR) repeat protein
LGAPARTLVARRSGGNPLFVEELVAALRHRGLLGADEARLQRFSAPTSLHALVLSRFERLDPELREAARLAAALGVEFEADVFQAVARDAWQDGALPHARPSAHHLEELARQGVLARSVDDAGGVVWSFTQGPFQAAVYSTLLSDNRRLAHRLAGETIERLHADDLDRYVPILLEHFSHTEDNGRIVSYARRAGKQALVLGAFPDAIEALSMALALSDKAADAGPIVDASSRRDLAMAYMWSGHLAHGAERAEQARAALDAVVAAGDADGAVALRGSARMILAEVALHRGELDASVAHARAAADDLAAGGKVFEAAEAECWQGFVLRTAGRVQEGLEHARRGWSVLKDAPNQATVARAGHDLGNVLRDVGALDEALVVFERSIEAGEALHRLGRKTDALWGSVASRSGRALIRFALGDLPGAIDDQRAVVARAEAYGNLPAQAYAGYHLATHLLAADALDDADATARRALDVCARLGMADRACRCLLVLAQVAERRDDVRGALEAAWRAESTARPLTVTLWLRALETLVPLLVRVREAGGLSQMISAAVLRTERETDPAIQRRVEALLAIAATAPAAEDSTMSISDAPPTGDEPTLDFDRQDGTRTSTWASRDTD